MYDFCYYYYYYVIGNYFTDSVVLTPPASTLLSFSFQYQHACTLIYTHPHTHHVYLFTQIFGSVEGGGGHLKQCVGRSRYGYVCRYLN